MVKATRMVLGRVRESNLPILSDSIDLHTPLYKHIGFFDMGEHDKYIDSYVEKIHEYDPDYEKPKPKKLFGII